jgi:hypothetical protein
MAARALRWLRREQRERPIHEWQCQRSAKRLGLPARKGGYVVAGGRADRLAGPTGFRGDNLRVVRDFSAAAAVNVWRRSVIPG